MHLLIHTLQQECVVLNIMDHYHCSIVNIPCAHISNVRAIPKSCNAIILQNIGSPPTCIVPLFTCTYTLT